MISSAVIGNHHGNQGQRSMEGNVQVSPEVTSLGTGSDVIKHGGRRSRGLDGETADQ